MTKQWLRIFAPACPPVLQSPRFFVCQIRPDTARGRMMCGNGISNQIAAENNGDRICRVGPDMNAWFDAIGYVDPWLGLSV